VAYITLRLLSETGPCRGRACPGHPRLELGKERRGCPRQARPWRGEICVPLL